MRIREDLNPFRRRAAWVSTLTTIALAILLIRLFDMQVMHGKLWKARAENNRLRRLPIEAPRGRIFDRNGFILAENRPSFQLLLFPDEVRDVGRTCLFLARAGLGTAAGFQELLRRRIGNTLAPQIVAESLSWQEVAAVRAHQSDHPELAVVDGFRRDYPYANLTGHAVGYLRQMLPAELAAHPGVSPNSLVGATGAEALMNATLAGAEGERRVVVTAIGQQLGVVSSQAAEAGTDMTLTLDIGLQRAAADALGSESGAVVGLDPETGAVRVLYSSPSFDPNIFTAHLAPKAWSGLAEDPAHPLQNRCIQGLYPPGSTIKPFYALEALTEGVVTPRKVVHCTGSVVLFGHTFHCWRRGGHGIVDLERSLEVSCDSYYYRLGLALGIDAMSRWLGRFGFGRKTGLGLPGERSGLVGNPAWVKRVRHHPWYPGTTISVAIGQGPILATPLQLARAYATLANGGHLIIPHLVERDTPIPAEDLGLRPADLEAVRTALEQVVHGSEGTARAFHDIPMAGKTGTSQVARLQEGVRVEDMKRRLRHHALFVGWAPLARPRLVVAVVVEHGGGGARAAAPIAAAVLEASLKSEDAAAAP